MSELQIPETRIFTRQFILFLAVILAQVALVSLALLLKGFSLPRLNQPYRAPQRVGDSGYAYACAVEQFKAGLSSADEELVSATVRLLAGLVVPELKESLKALKEKNKDLYVRVLPELYAMGEKDALKDLKEALLSDSFQTTVTALQQATRVPPLSVDEELRQDLMMGNEMMPFYVGNVLRSWGCASPETLKLLAEIAERGYYPDARLYSLLTLLALGEKEEFALKELKKIAESADDITAKHICSFFAVTKIKAGYEILLKLLESDEARIFALEALVPYEERSKAAAVNKYRYTGNTYQASLVLTNLASLGETEALSDYLELIARQEKPNWIDPILALRHWEDPRAIAFYGRIARDASRLPRLEISRSLRNYPWNPRAIALLKFLYGKAEDETEKSIHIQTLGMIGRPRDIGLALKLLREAKQPRTRIACAWAILNMQSGLPVNVFTRTTY